MLSRLNPLIGYDWEAGPPELFSSTASPGEIEYVVRAEITSRTASGLRLRGVTQQGVEYGITIEAVASGVVRLLLQPSGASTRERTVLARPPAHDASAVGVSVSGGGASRITTADLVAEIDLDPFHVSFTSPDGKVYLQQAGLERGVTGTPLNLPLGASRAGDRQILHESFACAPDEHFYGFGEKFTNFDKRGQWLAMWNDDAHGVNTERAYKNVPFFVSSKGYGLFVDSVTYVNFDMGATSHAHFNLLVPDSALDYYFVAGPDPEAVIRRYAELVGRPILPPKWAFGLWVSSSFTQDNAAAAIERGRMLREHEIPSDVLHLDTYWQRFGNWSDLEWNRDAFPDPQSMIQDIKALDFKLCLWINPYLGCESARFGEAEEKGFLLKTRSGEPYVLQLWGGDHPEVGIIDFTNPDAAAWWKELLRRLLKAGADVFKTDFGEGVPADAVAWNGMSGEHLHNLYTLLYNDLAAEVTAEMTGGPGLVWGRSTYAGGQRHAAQWAGDPNCTYEDMASTMRGGLSLAMCGHPFWSHDMGGFHGKPSADLYLRWSQFGLFSPLSRLHGTTTRLPWDYGENVLRIFRQFARLRYRLLPYIYSEAIRSAETSLPLMRPMVLQFPDDPGTYGLDLQYMFGPDMLVAPIYNREGSRSVYFPTGDWVDFWTADLIRGPSTRTVKTELNRMPLYVRGNALIPTIEPPEHIKEEPFGPVTVDAYLLSSGSLELRDTDGITAVSAAWRDSSLELEWKGAKHVLGFRMIALDGIATVDLVRANGRSLPRLDRVVVGRDGESGWDQASDGTVLVALQ